jgi:hypothetical protein
MIVNTRRNLDDADAPQGRGYNIYGAARFGQRSRLRLATAGQVAPWLPRVRIYETTSRVRTVVQRGRSSFSA